VCDPMDIPQAALIVLLGVLLFCLLSVTFSVCITSWFVLIILLVPVLLLYWGGWSAHMCVCVI